MIPELGRYAVEVLSSWALSLGLLIGLVWLSFRRAARVQRELDEVEGRRDGR